MSIKEELAKGVELQERDLQLLRGLLESRFMTTRHAAVLYFEGREQAAKQRLHKLKRDGFLSQKRQRAYERGILFLSPKAIRLLGERGILQEYPKLAASTLAKRAAVSERTLDHELSVMDVKCSFFAALQKSEKHSLAEFTTWPLLYRFKATRHSFGGAEQLVNADGFIRIHEKEPDGRMSEYSFFLEVDRSTEIHDTLLAKAASYQNYFKSGDYAVWRGHDRMDAAKHRFRVLMVFETAERRNNFAEAAATSIPPLTGQILLTTLDEASKDPLGEVWVRPADYLAAVRGTRYEPKAGSRKTHYRSDPERERFVESISQKRLIFGTKPLQA